MRKETLNSSQQTSLLTKNLSLAELNSCLLDLVIFSAPDLYPMAPLKRYAVVLVRDGLYTSLYISKLISSVLFQLK